MTVHEARQAIASYLLGQPVARIVLKEACVVLNSDPAQMNLITGDLGLEPDWTSACDAFRLRLAELSDRETMPEALAHLETCVACRRAYWDVRPLWVSMAARALRRLAEPLRLAIDQATRLVEQGIGPLSIGTPAPVAGLLGADTGAPPERREWLFADEQAGCTLRVSVAGLPGGKVGVTCAIEGEAATTPPVEDTRVEVRDAERDALHLAGRLVDFRAQPILLPPGSWILRVRWVRPQGECGWEVPLELSEAPG